MSEALGSLGINLGLLIAYTLNVLGMLVILRVVAYKPIVSLLQQRRERIAEGINNARKAEEALASAEANKKAILDEARAEAQRIISEARTRAEELAAQIKSEAQQEARRIVEQAETEAASERDRLLSEMRDQIVALSMAAAGHLISVSMDEKRQREEVERFFTALPPEVKALGTEDLVVVTAIPLTDEEKARIKKELGTEDVTFETDPRILGGVIVRAAGQQVDASYASQLTSMRVSLA
ncbi:MAG TPA: ATP synthase F0 subunit B [Chloroflexi bacterium]|nr:ATP synthase F0 subunit B [Chloroflexota bacterium]